MCLEFNLQSAITITLKAAFLTIQKKKTMKAVKCPVKSQTWAYKQAGCITGTVSLKGFGKPVQSVSAWSW